MWKVVGGPNLYAQPDTGARCWFLRFLIARAVGTGTAITRVICVSSRLSTGRTSADSAEIRGFVFCLSETGPVWDVVGGAENEFFIICHLFCCKLLIFEKSVWYGRFRTIFLHRMGNSEKIRCSRVGALQQICPKFVFFWLFPFVFDLARCLSSWWMVERLHQNNKKNKQTPMNDTNFWFCSFCVFFFLCCTQANHSAIMFYILHAHGFLLLFSFSSFIIINLLPYSIFLLFVLCFFLIFFLIILIIFYSSYFHSNFIFNMLFCFCGSDFIVVVACFCCGRCFVVVIVMLLLFAMLLLMVLFVVLMLLFCWYVVTLMILTCCVCRCCCGCCYFWLLFFFCSETLGFIEFL